MAFKKNVPDPVPQKFIDCCFVGCGTSAVVRMHTKTGWANVCRTHYLDVERVHVRSETLFVEECRKAWAERHGAEIAGKLAVRVERQPGEDEMERELADAAQA